MLSRHYYDKLKLIIFFILMINILDSFLTVIWVVSGDAVEANPLMANLIDFHPVLFMFCKQLLVFLGSVILWRFRENMFAFLSIFVIFLVYYATLLHHLRVVNLGSVQSLFH